MADNSFTKAVIDTIIAEAGSNPEGQAAVAAVILNRAREWGLTPDQVVKQKGQFTGYSNPGSGSRQAQQIPSVRKSAENAFNGVSEGTIPDPTEGGLSFRTKGTKQSAPNGTVHIGGNTFAKGKGNSAVAAIEKAAPTPMSRPTTAEAYAPSNKVRTISVNPDGTPVAAAKPGLQSLSNAAMNGVGKLPGKVTIPAMSDNINLEGSGKGSLFDEWRNPGLTAALLSPKRSVNNEPATRTVGTIPIRVSAADQVGSGPHQEGFDLIQRALAEQAPVKSSTALLQQPGAIKTTGTAGTAQMAAARPAVVDSLYAQIDAATKPQTYQTGMLGRGMASPAPVVSAAPQLSVAQRNALAATGGAGATRVANIPGQPAGSVALGKDVSRLPANAYAGTYSAPALAAIDTVAANRVAPTPRPRPVAMAAAVTTPRVTAKIPLTQFKTVNPVSQIVPQLQSRFNQTPIGKLTQALQNYAPQQSTQQPGYNGTTQVTSDQLAGGNGSIFTTNTVLPDSMNNKRWLTGY